jgi:hypothetical protein
MLILGKKASPPYELGMRLCFDLELPDENI